jgi:hypothetical protein
MQNLFPSATEPSLYEAGAGLVHKDHRNLGVNGAMLHFLYEDYVPKQARIEEMFGEPVCNHLFMQRVVDRFRFVEAAIEIALMPGNVYEKEGGSSERVTTLAAFRCYRPKPHRIFLPAAYVEELESIYARLDDTRELAPSQENIPSGVLTQLESQYFDQVGVARVALREVGADLDQAFARLEQEAKNRNSVVIQVWVNLGIPWVGMAVEEIRARGYFFCGAFPRWLGADAILMQKLYCSPGFESIQLYSDVAKQLFEVIKQDWKRAVSCLEGR